jgi:hypothetical protein
MEKQVRNCSDCSVEMDCGEINLKIDSDNYGFVVPFLPLTYVAGGSLPVIVYRCPKCGKLEFFAKGKFKALGGNCDCGHSKEQHRNWQYNCLVENCGCSEYK